MLRHLIRTGVMLPALMCALTLSGRVTAQTTPAPTICKDGTTSTATGRGACSGHGGVQKSSTGTAATGSAPTGSATGGTAPTTQKSTGSAATQATSAPGAAPAGATAQCKDGSYSKSKHHSGACSHHGGVQQWLDGSSSSQ